MLELVVLFLSVIANTIVSFFSYLNNPKNTVNRLFALFAFSLGGWSLFSYVSVPLSDHQLLLVRLVMFFVVLMNSAYFFMILTFPNSKFRFTTRRKQMLSLAGLTLLVTVSPWLFVALEGEGSNLAPVPGPGMLFFLVHSVLFVGGSILILIRKFKKAQGRLKNQLRFMLYGSILLFTLLPLTNFILPVVFNKSGFLPFSSIYATLFAVFVGYAIIRHRLLDIRLIVARAVAYLVLLVLVASLYSGVIYAISSAFFDSSDVSSTARITFTVAAVLIAFTFAPLKNWIDRATNRLFFRDAYDSQLVLDKLSSLLATEIELSTIVTGSSDLLVDALRPTKIRFAVFKDGETYIDHHVGTKSRKSINRSEINQVEESIIVRNESSHVIDKLLSAHECEVLLKLRTNEETVGAILLGPKQSGTVYSKQDIDLLTISEKELAIAVQNARYFEQIQEFNVKLQKEIQDATAELRASNTKLKELDEAKDEFISMASHQLRTPLTSVKGYISMVMEGDSGKIKPQQKKLLEEAFLSSQRMVYLIADLLNVSRLKTGKFVIEATEVNLADLAEQEVSQLKPTVRSRKLKLKFDKPSHFPKVWLDQTKIRQVIMNFIDNAIYYTPAGGNIEVTLTAKKNTIEYRVKDDGIGVPKADQAKLFAKFYRAGNAKQARPDGTGLGLYMAQRVVSAQGGSIIFQSKEGQGSTFGFSFPLSSVKTKQALLTHTRGPVAQAESRE